MGASQLQQKAIAKESPFHCSKGMSIDKTHIEEVIYCNDIPDFVASSLIDLYENVFCTLHRIQAYESLQGISTYIRRVDSIIHTIILFRKKGRTVSVLNQQISLKKEVIESFARKIFSEYENAQVISFYALDVDASQLDFPFQKLAVLEENVIYFPATVEDYLNRLKGQFRKQLRVAKEQLFIDSPGYHIKILSGKEVTSEQVETILGFARARMKMKGKDDYTRRVDVPVLVDMLRTCGHMAIAVIDGKICGGAVWFNTGRRHFHQLAAHDSGYDRYMLGNQIWLAAITHSLSLGGSECWLMGGASAHKARFGAQKRVFNSYVLYRSQWHVLLHPLKYMSLWTKDRVNWTKVGITRISTRPSPMGRCVKKGLIVVSLIQAGMRHFLRED